jgi:hypothetical protein
MSENPKSPEIKDELIEAGHPQVSGTVPSQEMQPGVGMPIKLVISAGYLFLFLSGVFLYLSTADLLSEDSGSQTAVFVKLTLSRLFGISGFLIGVVAIFNQKWTAGSLLLIGSLALPFLALLVHGTI